LLQISHAHNKKNIDFLTVQKFTSSAISLSIPDNKTPATGLSREAAALIILISRN
jgi:hypothetical protein